MAEIFDQNCMYFFVFHLCYNVGPSRTAWFCTCLSNGSIKIIVLPSQRACIIGIILRRWKWCSDVAALFVLFVRQYDDRLITAGRFRKY